MRFCFHDWGKWSAPLDTNNDYKKVQSRRCLNCNEYQVKQIKQPFNLWFGAKAIEVEPKEQLCKS
jgi:hypothetical protein